MTPPAPTTTPGAGLVLLGVPAYLAVALLLAIGGGIGTVVRRRFRTLSEVAVDKHADDHV